MEVACQVSNSCLESIQAHADSVAASSGSPKTRSIPLYNILWAELSEDQRTLTIDLAENISKHELRAAKLSFPTTPDSSTSSPSDDNHASAASKWAASLLSRAYGTAPRRKCAYVLVNPHAGPGGAQRKWDEQVRPIFEAARMPLTVHTTTRAREAIGLCAELDIDNYDIVVPCSGDGLAYECFNGLGMRADASRALRRVAVAHVPCGSGNALACNAFGTHRASLAALAIAKGVPTAMDLISVTQDGEQGATTRSLSFLSQTLGIMAEADLGTEHLRWMGEHRFTYGTVTRILKKKRYPCDLWAKVEIDHKDGVRAHYRRERENSTATTDKNGGGDVAGAGVGEGGCSTAELADLTDGAAHSAHSRGSSAVSDSEGPGLPPLRYGTVCDKLPEGWVKIPADDIGSFYTGNVRPPTSPILVCSCTLSHHRLTSKTQLAYMAPDVIFHNAALPSDGLMDVYTIDGRVPAGRVPGLLASCFTNGFIDHDLVQYYKVSAFRIVPKYATGPDEKGFISVDGEAVPFGPLQAEVHRGLGRIITKRGCIEAPGPKGWDEVTPLERIRA